MPSVLSWALSRSGKTVTDLESSFPKLSEWLSSDTPQTMTMRQAQNFAAKTYTPFSLLFLDESPKEPLPIADMRTVRNQGVGSPSGDLLDTIYHAQRSQDWYRDYAVDNGANPLEFVGSVGMNQEPTDVATCIAEKLDFTFEDRSRFSDTSRAYRHLVDRAEDLGVLVLTNGVVGNNTHRRLNVEEFRGFSLSDNIAPLIFVNGADSPTARIFTLLHELGHIWLGHSALSDVQPDISDSAPGEASTEERWCNQLAGEVLLPTHLIPKLPVPEKSLKYVHILARQAKCSSLVVLHRLYDANVLDWHTFSDLYEKEKEKASEHSAGKNTGDGGNFYYTVPLRYSPTFTRAVVVSALEGTTLYRDAFRMLGTRKPETFRELAHQMGVV